MKKGNLSQEILLKLMMRLENLFYPYHFVEEITEKKAAILVKQKENEIKCEQCDYTSDPRKVLKRIRPHTKVKQR
jgi:hypothetical protein